MTSHYYLISEGIKDMNLKILDTYLICWRILLTRSARRFHSRYSVSIPSILTKIIKIIISGVSDFYKSSNDKCIRKTGKHFILSPYRKSWIIRINWWKYLSVCSVSLNIIWVRTVRNLSSEVGKNVRLLLKSHMWTFWKF